jgi:hypothetical protein
VVITPARLTAWAQNAAGVIEDLQALADPGGDRIYFWDDSAGTATHLSVGTGLDLTSATLSVDVSGFGSRTLTAGVGISGGGDLSADRTFTLDLSELTTDNAPDTAADFLVFRDTSEGADNKILIDTFEALLDHDALTNFVADEHIAHSGVTITAGVGLTGGGTIAATRTLDLDIDGLTIETTIDSSNDAVVFYDDSASAHRKVAVASLIGDPLGDGKWYRATSVQTLAASTEATVVYNAAEYDALEKGTFSTSTGEYTVGSDATRIMVMAQITTDNAGEAIDGILQIQVNGTAKAYNRQSIRAYDGDLDPAWYVFTTLTLAASDVVRIRAEVGNGFSKNIKVGTSLSFISIVELG